MAPIVNSGGVALTISKGAAGNAIERGVIAASSLFGAFSPAIYLQAAATTTISGSYVQGSSAVIV